jgi:hypothetical protein
MNVTDELELYDGSGWAYEIMLEFQKWYEEEGWIEDVNSELRFASLEERGE